MARKKKRVCILKDMVLDEVSLCGDPANPDAHISLFKTNAPNGEPEDKEDKDMFVKTAVPKNGGKDKEEPKTFTEDQLNEAVAKAVKEASDKKDAELEVAKKLAELTDVEKAYYNGLDEEGKTGFLKMNTKNRAAAIKKAQEGEELLVVEGETIRKSEVGSAMFEIIKKQQERMAVQEENIRKEKDARELVEFEKTAKETYPNIPVESKKLAQVLKSITGLPEEVKATITDILKAANETNRVAMKAQGTDSTGTTEGRNSTEQLNKMATEYASKNNVSFHKAYAEVIQTEEGAKLYRQYLKGE
jgi:hypothetical protein